jgi:CheY-like chemotaxis protein
MSLPSAPLRGLRIVVTDDDPKLLLKIVEILSDAGHNVFAAYDGQSACELAEYIPNLDLVISNTRMGSMKAPELIARVRAVKPWLGILHMGDPLPAGPLTGVPSVREPFTAVELLDAISALLASSANAPEKT